MKEVFGALVLLFAIYFLLRLVMVGGVTMDRYCSTRSPRALLREAAGNAVGLRDSDLMRESIAINV